MYASFSWLNVLNNGRIAYIHLAEYPLNSFGSSQWEVFTQKNYPQINDNSSYSLTLIKPNITSFWIFDIWQRWMGWKVIFNLILYHTMVFNFMLLYVTLFYFWAVPINFKDADVKVKQYDLCFFHIISSPKGILFYYSFSRVLTHEHKYNILCVEF